MAKQDKLTATNTELNAGINQESWANTLALAIDQNATPVINRLAAIKGEYEGGPFVVLRNVVGMLSAEQTERLPEPHTKTGNNPAWYKVQEHNGKKATVKEVYFYDRLAEMLPSVRAAMQRKDLYERSMDNTANQEGVTEEIRAIPIANRVAEIDKCRAIRTVAMKNVGNAFELYFQLKAADEYKGASYSLTYAIGDDGKLCDGEDGREWRIENTKTPIHMVTTVENRKQMDYDKFSIGTFLKFNYAVAEENGETWASLMATLPKKGADNALPVAGVTIMTVEKFITVVNDLSEYLHRTLESTDKASLDAIQKMSNKTDEDGDMFYYNLAYLDEFLRGQIQTQSPQNQVRYQALVNKFSDKNVLAVAQSKAKAKALLPAGKKAA